MKIRSYHIAIGIIVLFVAGYVAGRLYPPRQNGDRIVAGLQQAVVELDRFGRLRARRIIESRHTEIFDDPAAMSLGNRHGDITLVEFFDYRCLVCKEEAPVVDKLIAADPRLRVVLHELPILGPESEYLAHLALAAGGQGRYREFYNGVFAHVPPLADRRAVDQAVQAAGFDPEKLAALGQAPEIEAEIQKDLDLGKAIGLNDTPAWLVDDLIVPVDGNRPVEQQLADYIDLARKTVGTKAPLATSP